MMPGPIDPYLTEIPMKLYYKAGACSLSPHIVLREAGIAFDLVKVDTKTKTTEDGQDFLKLNPYGYVPVLQLDNGDILTEGPAIVQYLADRVPGNQLAPLNGTMERYRVQSALGFINSELHKTIGSLFAPNLSDEARAATAEKIDTRLSQLSAQLEGKDYIANNTFSVADVYLFVVMNWLKFVKLDINQWPVIAAHHARIAARPSVQAALKAEGIG